MPASSSQECHRPHEVLFDAAEGRRDVLEDEGVGLDRGLLAPVNYVISPIRKQTKQPRDETTIQNRKSRIVAHACSDSSRLIMPPRLSLSALPSRAIRIQPQRRYASGSAHAPEVYDVVCVGGGPAGLSLLTGLKSTPITSGLKVALIEGQDLQKNRLQKDASLESFSNRCSSLTPASVRNLQGV
jgi:hypothetical protein